MDSILIREAESRDAEAFFRLNRDAMGYDFDLDRTRRRLDFVLQKNGHKIFVAEQNGTVVGYVHAEDYELIYSEPLKNILGIAVAEDARRQGIGGRFLCAVEDWARRTGASGVRLVSGCQRTGAHRFYEAQGYISRKDQKNYIKLFEK